MVLENGVTKTGNVLARGARVRDFMYGALMSNPQRVGAWISGNPKRKDRDPWSWSPTREPRALAELEMS